MSETFIGILIISVTIIIGCLYLAPLITKEGFVTTHFSRVEGVYPVSVDKAILEDFPRINSNKVSNDSATTMWWKFPIFTLSSFKQLTNNIRYVNNPDNGTCVRPEFCGALYRDIKNKPNEIYPLPPAEESSGARVGYFRSTPNQLFFSIPTNENILY